MIRIETVTLMVTYDDQDDGFNVPRARLDEWDWAALLDLGAGESVEVIGE